MTTDIEFLGDTLSKRIAHGTAGAKDLTLLQQLLRCERRRSLLMGLLTGAGTAAVLQVLVFVALH